MASFLEVNGSADPGLADSPAAMKSRATFFIAIALLVPARGSDAPQPYQWEPGSVFREHTFHAGAADDGKNPRKHFSEIDPGSKRTEMAELRRNPRVPRPLNISLAGVVCAELLPEYWGGHIGTTAWVQPNRRSWIPLPRPVGTPGSPEHYYHTVLGSRAVPIRLRDLKDGENTFQFAAGPQIWGSFDWGFYWIYDFTLRLFHERRAEHPSGRIANLESGATLAENPVIVVAPQPGAAPIQRIDVFAWYEDFNASGSGFHREWHGQTIHGRPYQHVGSASAAPWTVRWDTEWVADQSEPIRLVARIVDAAGWHTITPIVDDLRLERGRRRVMLVRVSEMPEGFGVRAGREMSCVLNVDRLPGRPSRAQLKLMTWSGSHVERIRLNDTQLSPRIGREHDFQVDVIEVPADAVKAGRNEFAMFSSTTHHAAEVGWPGPVLLLEFADP